MENNRFEVISTPDKAKRDEMYREYRESTDPLERQVVKFSSSNSGGALWSIAYPAVRDVHPTARRVRKEAQRVREKADDCLPDGSPV
jgi:hypothetical protein